MFRFGHTSRYRTPLHTQNLQPAHHRSSKFMRLIDGRRLVLMVLFTVANATPPDKIAGTSIYLNRDLSTGSLSQWTHRDYGLGTDVGSNDAGGGYLWYHSNVEGRSAVGVTATSSARASQNQNSNVVYLWEPPYHWNHAPYEIWLRTSVMFPSAATISASGATGEQPFQPTTGEWNWFLEFHNDASPLPACAKEYANIAFTVKTDDPVRSGEVGTKNVRMAVRIMGGSDCAPNVVWVDGPPLVRDHWYEILLHVKWDGGRGIFEWYLDNFQKPYYSNKKIPTLYTRPDNYLSPSYTSLTLANYRLHASWNSTTYLGPLVITSTKFSALTAF